MKKLSNNSLVIFLILLSVILGGGISPSVKVALKQLSPEVFTFFRFALSTVIIFPFFLKQKTGIRKDLFKLIPVSLLLTINVLLFAYGVRLTTADIGQLLYVMTPIIVLLLSHFLLDDKINPAKILGIVLGFSGTFLVIVLPIIEGSKFSGNLLGNILILAAVTSFSFYTVFSKRFQRKYTPIELTLGVSLTTTVAMLILSLPQLPKFINELPNISHLTILAVLYVGIAGTAVSYGIYQYVIKLGSATIASTILYLQPLATIVWAYFLLSEKLSLGFVIGGLLAIFGTIIVTRYK